MKSPSVSNRREFLKSAAAGTAALATAASHARVLGANERISIGIIGCGQRGFGAHMPGVHKHAKEQNVEITAVCDVWTEYLERAAPYPEGFMVSYCTNFGNGSGNRTVMYGTHGIMDFSNRNKPVVSGAGATEKGSLRGEAPVEPVECSDHFLDWLQCLRSRETPVAPIEAGYQHSVACILSDLAYETGRRQVYDHGKREISEG